MPGDATASSPPDLLVGWTTVATATGAEKLARLLIKGGHAACVQTDGPIRSWYRWEGKVCEESEIRLWIKGTARQFAALPEILAAHHPYATPQWVVVKAHFVGEKYLQWANTSD